MSDFELRATLAVEWLSPAGHVNCRKASKDATATLRFDARNQLCICTSVKATKGKEVTIVVEGPMTIHKRFIEDGKTTIVFPKAGMQLLFSQADSDDLKTFLEDMLALKEGKRPPSKGPTPLGDKSNSKSPPKIKFARKDSMACPPVISPTKTKVMTSDLSDEQKAVFDAVITRRSVFFTGGAGTGKSFLLKRILSALPRETTFATATTGVAAYNIGGMTVHAFSGIMSGEATNDQCLVAAKKKADLWRRCQVLIVDEISMMDAAYFDKLEWVARAVRGSQRPFGGIQLVICGDFLQLPPVCKKGQAAKQYSFQAATWTKCVPVVIELHRIYRQTDPEFIRLLRHVRRGECPPAVLEGLRATKRNNVNIDGILPTELCTHVGGVEAANERQLALLPDNPSIYTCRDNIAQGSDDWVRDQLDRICPAPKRLQLKIGAQVMVVKNVDVQNGLVNGGRGVVIAYSVERDMDDRRLPVVRFLSGAERTIYPESWAVNMFGKELGKRTQIPLTLAWAISIHKSQGMTLDCAKMDISRVFEYGQAYVALSRGRTLDRIQVTAFSPENIRADPVALNFYDSLAKKNVGAAAAAAAGGSTT